MQLVWNTYVFLSASLYVSIVLSKPLKFASMLDLHSDFSSFINFSEDKLNRYSDAETMSCIFCKRLISFVQYEISRGTTHEKIVSIATEICIELEIEDERVCVGITRMFQVSVLLIIYLKASMKSEFPIYLILLMLN